MKKLVFSVLCACVFASVSATQYSCLSIITAAKQAGKWESLKAWIAAAGLKDEWDKCAYLSDDYPQYATITNALVAAGVVTDEEIRTILATSRDTAIPDEMIRRVVSNDCETASGRVKWHGKVRRTIINTNALTKVQIYDDGYAHTTRFVRSVPPSVDEIISAAERSARRIAREKARAAAQSKAKAERISALQTNMTALATALAEKKQYPLELATMLLQHELNTLVGTNVINAIITPRP